MPGANVLGGFLKKFMPNRPMFAWNLSGSDPLRKRSSSDGPDWISPWSVPCFCFSISCVPGAEGAEGCGKVAEPIRDSGFLREHFSGAKRRGADRAK